MRKLLLVVPFTVLGGIVSASAAQYVVVNAVGTIADTLKTGALVDDASLVVPANDKVMLMGADGVEIEVDGPHKGEIGQATHSDNGMLAKISEAMQDRPGVFTAARGGLPFAKAAKPVMDDPWAIDALYGGTDCVFEGRKVTLWKPPSADSVPFIIRDEAANKGAELTWPANQSTLPWPSAVPIVDGDEYNLKTGDKPRKITLKTVPSAGSPGVGSLVAAGAGCDVQAASLLKSVTPSRVIPPS